MKFSMRRFTLIELLVALGVLSIMIVIMMDFFGQCQRAWRTSESSIRVFENARTIFDVIERDLFHALASTDDGREIPFAIKAVDKDGGAEFGPFPCMVSKIADTEYSRSRLAKVTYKVKSPTNVNGSVVRDIDDEPVRFFKRSLTVDHTSSGNSLNSKWNFYGVSDGIGADWADDSRCGSYYGIAGGVLEMRMHYSSLSPKRSDYEDASELKRVHVETKALQRNYTYHYLPRVIDVEVTLFDYKTESASDPYKTKKTFFKRFYVGQGPKNY